MTAPVMDPPAPTLLPPLSDAEKASGGRHTGGWWRCRYCRGGEAGTFSVEVERGRVAVHEALCPERPDDDPVSDEDVTRFLLYLGYLCAVGGPDAEKLAAELRARGVLGGPPPANRSCCRSTTDVGHEFTCPELAAQP